MMCLRRSLRGRSSLFVCSLVKGNRTVLVNKVFAVFDGLILVPKKTSNSKRDELGCPMSSIDWHSWGAYGDTFTTSHNFVPWNTSALFQFLSFLVSYPRNIHVDVLRSILYPLIHFRAHAPKTRCLPSRTALLFW